KGGGVFRKKPVENLSYLNQILWPMKRFEISYSRTERAVKKTPKVYKQRNFMIGNFSMPYVERILNTNGGKDALSLVFSTEKNRILEVLEEFDEGLPTIDCFDPNNVYSRLAELITEKIDRLERTIVETKVEVQPLYDEASHYEQKAEDARERAAVWSNDKESEQYKEYIRLASEYSDKAKKLREEAKNRVDYFVDKLNKNIRSWTNGQKKYLGLKKGAKIESISNLETFYFVYWVARFESPEGVRYLVLNNKARQEKDLQAMLHYDQNLREEVDRSLDFTVIETNYTCYSCGEPIEKTQETCANCGNVILKCSVCKLPISAGEQIGKCPQCESKGHLTHLQEWVKSQGKCPYCLQNLRTDAIVILEEKKQLTNDS
ncbi:MAG: hypothetical protein ACFFDI_31295, partial [Promethearchaeota archaeon]